MEIELCVWRSDFAAHQLAMAHGIDGFGAHGIAAQRALGAGDGADVGTFTGLRQRIAALGQEQRQPLRAIHDRHQHGGRRRDAFASRQPVAVVEFRQLHSVQGPDPRTQPIPLLEIRAERE